MFPSLRTRRHSIWLVALLVAVAASGCVRRRLTVRSNPAGALGYVDNVPVGRTPFAVNYTYYGTREIRLVKDGYETLTVNQPIPTPWYEIPPLDLVSDTMIPWEVRDERTVSYNLMPKMMVPTEHLLARAEDLRQQTHGGPQTAGTTTLPGAETLPPGGSALPPTTQAPEAQTLPPSGTPPVVVPPRM